MTDPTNHGGSTDYYRLPAGACELQDLIEHKAMNFALGNIFKAAYRMGEAPHSDQIREYNKIAWYAERELARLRKGEPRLTWPNSASSQTAWSQTATDCDCIQCKPPGLQ